ncbi:related to PQ loop repeat protein [Cephalotrichum gorgonifer]|uniref:Related to PQ loop repeat protein n=1 Tax=Cephalotrichum gorgonifer TaxID=2041049 RepID=A0AAE8MTX8_9PEZI|nr:related to PQ loop repeat protein [Cephalotrichum gorgonifer]
MEQMLLEQHPRCRAMQEPNYVNLVVSIIIVLGMLVSYLPQHYRIISRRTAEGISPYFVLLGTTSATSGFAAILTVEPSRQDIACCKTVGAMECLGGMLGIAQLGVQWICFSLILVLFLVFFRYDDAQVSDDDELEVPPPGWRTAILVGAACLAHGLLVIVITGILATGFPGKLQLWANSLGVMSAALAGVQYVPQIVTTYRLKRAGSLSIPMMCMQTPGGFLVAASLFARLGAEGWSTWSIYILTALMQGIVLVMAIYYEFNKPGGLSVSPPVSPPLAPRRPGPNRAYSEGWEEGLPGPYTAHPERYAETPEEFERLEAREERQVDRERQPLLRPGGIGNGAKPRGGHSSARR